jgi:hypothetical protein
MAMTLFGSALFSRRSSVQLSYLSPVGFSDAPCDDEILTVWLAAEPKSRPYS